jgi:perosamine synthetase
MTALVFGKSWHITKEQALQTFEEHDQPSRPFSYPLSMMPAFKDLISDANGGAKNNPVAYNISSRAINLPSALCLTEDQIKAIVKTLRVLLKCA